MLKRGGGHRRALYAFGCATLILFANASQTLHARCAPGRFVPVVMDTPEPPPKWNPWSVTGMIGAMRIAADAQANNMLLDRDMLLAYGPRFADSYSEGTFAVQGYVQAGWPVVIDFLPQPDSCTWLEISADQKPLFSKILNVDGRGGRNTVEIDLPAVFTPS